MGNTAKITAAVTKVFIRFSIFAPYWPPPAAVAVTAGWELPNT